MSLDAVYYLFFFVISNDLEQEYLRISFSNRNLMAIPSLCEGQSENNNTLTACYCLNNSPVCSKYNNSLLSRTTLVIWPIYFQGRSSDGDHVQGSLLFEREQALEKQNKKKNSHTTDCRWLFNEE